MISSSHPSITMRKHIICEHGRRRNRCKECGGSQICEHGRQRSKCKECGGSSICEHGRRRNICKECGGSQICEHGRQRDKCKECGGKGICEHGRERYYCKECGGKGICEHGKRRDRCKECRTAGDTSRTADKKRRQQPAHEASEPAAKRHSQSGAISGEQAAAVPADATPVTVKTEGEELEVEVEVEVEADAGRLPSMVMTRGQGRASHGPESLYPSWPHCPVGTTFGAESSDLPSPCE